MATSKVFFDLLKKEARGKIPDILQKGAEVIWQSKKQEQMAKDLTKLSRARVRAPLAVSLRPKQRLDYDEFARTGRKVYLPLDKHTDIFLVDVSKTGSGSKSKTKSKSKSKTKSKSGSKSGSKSEKKVSMSPKKFYGDIVKVVQRSPRTRAQKKAAEEAKKLNLVMLFGRSRRRRAH